MKQNAIKVWTANLTFLAVIGGAMTICSAATGAQERGGERLLQGSDKPAIEAPSPSDKQPDGEVGTPRRQRDKPRVESRRAEAESNRAERRGRFVELQLQLKQLRQKLRELETAGQGGEKVELKEQISRVERELERTKDEVRDQRPRREVERRPGRFERGAPDQPPPADGRRPSGDMPDARRSLQHLQVAIENLHAAGLHEPAEHLAQEERRMREQLQAPSPPREPGARPGGRPAGSELEPLREEIRSLHEAVQDLRRKVDELSRERR